MARMYTRKDCAFSGCDREARKVGLCSGHYAQARKGKPLTPIHEGCASRRLKHRTCTVSECTRGHMAHGYCEAHYRQFRKGAEVGRLHQGPSSIRIDGDLAYIELRNADVEAIIDASDVAIVQGYRWSLRDDGYPAAKEPDQPAIKLHRLIMAAREGDETDHVNGVRHDCRRSNLRIVTRFQNMQNRGVRKDSLTGVRGVTYEPKKGLYRAYYMVDGNKVYLGRYKHLADAKAAVVAAREAAMTHTNEERVWDEEQRLT